MVDFRKDFGASLFNDIEVETEYFGIVKILVACVFSALFFLQVS